MKCSQVKKKLTAYIDGEISENEQAIISEHVKSCASCRQELEELAAVTRTLDEVVDVEVTPYFRAHLKTRLREEKADEEKPFPFLEWIRRATIPVAAAALFLFSIVAGGQLGRSIYQATAQTTRVQAAEIDYITGLGGFEEMSDVSFSAIYEDLYTGGTE
ncbi:MAG: zf-HC2 domain-containing protein [candidate division WOR-3 bacterium]|nr:MAG: zf-HC2 domain-containing protein [candidate division WOR-3 bacterium]